MAALPHAVTGHAASAQGGRLVVTGGLGYPGSDGPVKRHIQIYDPTAERWQAQPPLQQARHGHAQVTLPDRAIMVLGGRAQPRGLALKSVEWLGVACEQPVQVAPLPEAMATPTAHVLPDGRVLAIGGAVAALYTDPEGQAGGDRWELIPLRAARESHASALLPDGSVVIVGGLGQRSIERVWPEQKRAQVLSARLPEPLDDLAAVALGPSRVWVVGGQSSRTGRTTAQTWWLELDIPKPPGDEAKATRKTTPQTTSRLVPGPTLPVPDGVADAVVLPWQGGVLVLGGESDQNRGDTELRAAFWLSPDGETLKTLPKMPRPHDDAAGAVLPDGSVWIAGGLVTSRILGSRWPQPIASVHRLGPEAIAIDLSEPTPSTPE